MKFLKKINFPIHLLLFFFLISTAAFSQLKILPLGDSITQGEILVVDQQNPAPPYKASRLQGFRADGAHGVLAAGNGGYRLSLQEMLDEMGWDSEMVGRRTEGGGHHEGYPGYMTSDILPMLREILEVNDPDIVLLHIGTNDLPDPIDADSCYQNILEMLDIIHHYNRDIEIILAQIIPCLENTNLGRKRYPEIEDLNALLAPIPDERHYVSLVDMWTPFVETEDWENELMSDSWHPNSRGYYLMAEIWQDMLDNIVSGRSPVITSISPASGFLFSDNLQCTLDGNYFKKGLSVFLEASNGEQLAALEVDFEDKYQVTANFNLSAGTEGEWRVWAVNPNKMRSIHSQDALFSILPNEFLISGSVQDSLSQPIPGAEIFLTSSDLETAATTNEAGHFEFTGIQGEADYTLTIYKPGYHFNPVKHRIINLQGDQIQLDFTGRQVYLAGRVLDQQQAGLANVPVHISGAQSTTLITDGNGYFRLDNPAPGSTTVTPAQDFWNFTPAQQTVDLDTSDVILQFTGTYNPPFYTISGQIFDQSTAREIQGVTVSVSGAQNLQTKTDSLGFFRFDSLEAFLNYTITPQHPEYRFEPESRQIDSLNSARQVDFDGIYLSPDKRISGTIRDQTGNAIANIPLLLSGGVDTLVQTDENGQYIFNGLTPRQNYSIRSAKAYIQLSPDSLYFAGLEQNLTGQNFIVLSRKYPPQIIDLPAQTISEGGQFQPVYLNEYVTDPDDSLGSMRWTVANFAPLPLTLNGNQICYLSPPHADWYGEVKIWFIVTDPGGLSDSVQVNYRVKNVNDPPQPFSLTKSKHLVPAADGRLKFTWRPSVDPDAGDQIFYQVVISSRKALLFIEPFETLAARQDTFLVTKLKLEDGYYFWSVQATDKKSYPTACLETGTLALGQPTSTKPITETQPNSFALKPNYPNPFNPETIITYELPVLTAVKLTIYDELGKQVVQLFSGTQPAGRYQLRWNGRNQQGRLVSSGIYFCKLKAKGFVKTIEMSFIK